MTTPEPDDALIAAMSRLAQPGRRAPLEFSLPHSDGGHTKAAVLEDGSLTRHQIGANGAIERVTFHDAASGQSFDLTAIVRRALSIEVARPA